MTSRLSNLLGYSVLSPLFASKEETITPDIKRQVATLTVAVAVASVIDLPSAPVGSIREFYHGQQATVMLIVDTINSNYPLDLDAILKLTYQFWCERYEMVHGTGFAGYLDQLNFELRREKLLNPIQNRAVYLVNRERVTSLIQLIKQGLEG